MTFNIAFAILKKDPDRQILLLWGLLCLSPLSFLLLFRTLSSFVSYCKMGLGSAVVPEGIWVSAVFGDLIPWRRERLPIPVFWPAKFHGLYSLWGPEGSDTTERLSLSLYKPHITHLYSENNDRTYLRMKWDQVVQAPNKISSLPSCTIMRTGNRSELALGYPDTSRGIITSFRPSLLWGNDCSLLRDMSLISWVSGLCE